MEEMKIFENEEFGAIRTVEIDGDVWFVAKDISDKLGYAETSNMMKRIDREDFISSKLEGMNMRSILINESGLYSAILGSKLESAKRFKRWVTSEVLPTIRKHGAYMTDITIEKMVENPDLLIELATKLKQEKEERKRLEKQVEEERPHAILGRAITTAKTSILIGDLAKILNQNGVNIGAKRLFEWMRNNGYLIKRKGTDWNMPTQRSMDLELFEVKESVHIDGNGCNKITRTTKVTGKGQAYFVNRFLSKKE